MEDQYASGKLDLFEINRITHNHEQKENSKDGKVTWLSG